MQNVATIICNPSNNKIDETIINKVFIAIERKKGVVSNLNWLAPDVACDVFFDHDDLPKVREALKNKLYELEVDFIVQKNENRKKKLLMSDMDSTIIEQECIDEIAAELGIKDEISIITNQAMNGDLDFNESLLKRVALLEGLESSKLEDVYKNKITLMKGAQTLLKTMAKNGSYSVLVSGGFTFFTDKIKNKLGFNADFANILEIKDGKLTGKVVPPILNADSKLKTLHSMTEKLNITKDDIISVGDGANDIPMLAGSGLGIAAHAKENVQEQIEHNIVFTDLTSLLFAQGYNQDEIV